MITLEVTRILEVMEPGEEFTTYEANEYFPHLTAQEIASILRRDERIINAGKRYCRDRTGYKNITVWVGVSN